ncbi:hypothetical protein [Treponema zioleckii]|uniref:hypothetical protein n=1 Tax=Treponema zioleckii TaxID=331680 RepID=UPI00168A5CAD|nr:hypothetical protein [Treponema zioleckii]
MKSETYRRKIEELEEKIANTHPRFCHKIEAMEVEKERLEQKLAEKEEEEAQKRNLEDESESETENDEFDDYDYDEEDEDFDDCDDTEDNESADDEWDEESKSALKKDLELEGHTEAYIQKALELGTDDSTDIFSELSDDEAKEEFCYQLDSMGVSEQTKEFFISQGNDFPYWEKSSFDSINIFEDAFQAGLAHYGDEQAAITYADACSSKGCIGSFNDEFEEFVRAGEPWLLQEGFGFAKDEYSADDLISMYYKYDAPCLDYDDDENGFSFDDDHYRSKEAVQDDEIAGDEEEEEIKRNMEKW